MDGELKEEEERQKELKKQKKVREEKRVWLRPADGRTQGGGRMTERS